MKLGRSKRPHGNLQIVAGVVWCKSCDASGFLPSRVRHNRGCFYGNRPITWSPPPVIL